MPYSTRKYSNVQEKAVAKKVKGSRVPNSGAAMFYAGDVITQHFMIECKTKIGKHESFSVKKEWITKAKEEALAMGKPFWALAFNFGGDKAENYYILPEAYFLQIKQLLEGDTL